VERVAALVHETGSTMRADASRREPAGHAEGCEHVRGVGLSRRRPDPGSL